MLGRVVAEAEEEFASRRIYSGFLDGQAWYDATHRRSLRWFGHSSGTRLTY